MSTRNIFFKLYITVKQTFSSSVKASSNTDIPTSFPLKYSFGRNYECAVREINVTNAIDLIIEISGIQSLSHSNPHRKIENAENRDFC